MRSILVALAIASALSAAVTPPDRDSARAVAPVTATRLPGNPLITTRSSPALGDNINGPTVIRVPEWVVRPLGRYYMYFAHHMGAHIRLAHADAIGGPWRIHEPGTLHVRDTAFYRPPPDPPENLEDFYTHVASPEVMVDHEQRRLLMWFHGWWTEGSMWPAGPAAAREWARARGYGQFTQAAASSDGVAFTTQPAVSRLSYLRVFQHRGSWYGMGRLGQLARATDPQARFEPGPNPFDDGPYARRVRHVAVLVRGDRLQVFFSAIGDAPERILHSTIDLTGDWSTWQASVPTTVLEPAAPYECIDQPVGVSAAGDVKGRVRQLRDPAVFEENGRVWLFYAICGEQGIAAAELQWPPAAGAE